MKNLTPDALAKFFDHTLLKPFATTEDFRVLCNDAKQYGFMMVAINSAPVKLCKELLTGSDVKVGAAISFPLGQTTAATKVCETKNALYDGADEIDYVVNLSELKSGNLRYIEDEMRGIVELCREHGAASKVIFENCYLTDDEKKALCEIALKVRPDFIKTSTGFGSGGATIEDIQLMIGMVGDAVKVKASGGVRTLDMALELISLGVERIGSSASKEIVDAYRATGQEISI